MSTIIYSYLAIFAIVVGTIQKADRHVDRLGILLIITSRVKAMLARV